MTRKTSIRIRSTPDSPQVPGHASAAPGGSRPAVGRLGLLGLGLLGLGGVSCRETPPDDSLGMMLVEQVVRDLLTEPNSWEALSARADSAPRVEVICPSYSTKTDGVDMPALVVSPPGAVRLRLAGGTRAPDSGPVRLVTRVGVDQLTFGRLNERVPQAHFAFEVRAGERVLARQVVELVHGQHQENAWVDLGGPDGVDVEGEEEVTLHTQALRPDGSEIELPFAVRAGFGSLRLAQKSLIPRTRSSPERPNVILVLMDTVRTDRLSTYGYEKPTSPRLTELAERGVLFERCYSTASWTWPATASLLTGLTTMEHGLVGERSSFLFEHSATLAEHLQLGGMSTAAWSGNPIISARRNFDQGFETFLASEAGDMRETAEYFEEIRTFLRAQGERRFFLYLHLADPHIPHEPLDEAARIFAPDVPLAFRKKCDDYWHDTGRGQGVLPGGEVALDAIATAEEREWAQQLYDASVWSGDYWLGQMLDELVALGLDDQTLVAFVGDHGEELFERGFLGHGHSLKQELVLTPMVVAGPGVPVGKRHSGVVSARMLGPLLARLAGFDFGDGAAALRTLENLQKGEDYVIFSTARGWWKGRNNLRLVGLTDGKWKLNLAIDGAPWGSAEPSPGGDVELFDLEADPMELEDVSARFPEVTASLRSLLLERMAAYEARRVGTDIPAGEATLRMLEDLGYAGGDEDHEHR